ncbi:helix-turn-helix transcriptional regulator [Mycobacteroides abscessus]|uniref:helix-turn-helix transcriptional regulator n=1 Tax=Mycobacteroides abscessus TaxID=36809 RepID=UPI00355C7FA8
MAKPADPADPWLSRDEAAERLSLKSKTLAMWAYRDQGPRYYRFNGGPCRYRLSDVLAWVESQAAGGTP